MVKISLMKASWSGIKSWTGVLAGQGRWLTCRRSGRLPHKALWGQKMVLFSQKISAESVFLAVPEKQVTSSSLFFLLFWADKLHPWHVHSGKGIDYSC